MSDANFLARYALSYLVARGHVAMRNNTTGVVDPEHTEEEEES